jgi:hypothetical protein
MSKNTCQKCQNAASLDVPGARCWAWTKTTVSDERSEEHDPFLTSEDAIGAFLEELEGDHLK